MSQENQAEYLKYILRWLQLNGAILASVTALFIAVFQDRMRAWVMKPKLGVTIDLKPPDCLKIPMTAVRNGEVLNGFDAYYFRLRITNNGNQKADKVEVFALKLLEEKGKGQWKEVISFLPMNFVWANDHSIFYEIISPKMHRHCDLAHIIDPRKRLLVSGENRTWDGIPAVKAILSFDTHAKPNTLCYLYPPGHYRLVVVVGAANAKPVEKSIDIEFDGSWYDNEDQMFEKGINVQIQ